MTTFTVHGDPKAQPRPRAFARKIGGTYTARVYDAGTAEGWKSLVAVAARPHLPVIPFSAVRLRLEFAIQRPKGHFGSGSNSRTLKASSPTRHTQKPDADNLAKAVMDCLTQIGFFKDEQVVQLEVSKAWAGGAPGVVVQVEEVGG